MSRAKFFDRTGKEVSASDALHRDGSTLRDGFTVRITKLEFVINPAKALGLSLPAKVLAVADEVVE